MNPILGRSGVCGQAKATVDQAKNYDINHSPSGFVVFAGSCCIVGGWAHVGPHPKLSSGLTVSEILGDVDRDVK